MVQHPLIEERLPRRGDPLRIRQLARLAARGLGFSAADQARIATAVSETVRALLPLGSARMRLDVARRPSGEESLRFELRVTTSASPDPSLLPAHLLDSCTLSQDGDDVVARLERLLTQPVTPERLDALRAELATETGGTTEQELQRRQEELLSVLSDLQQRQDELRLANQELADTNRGVLALYAELDDRAEQLRHANQLKDQFLSYLSHEFRTPLNSMSMLSKMLLDEFGGPVTPEQATQIRLIRKSSDDLLEMVNDLLDLAKIEAGKLDVTVEAVDLAEVFSALRGMMRPLAASDRVELILESTEGLPALETDAGKLAQILRNLISNALKFTVEGEVRVSAQRREDGCTVFTVADTGIGIPKEEQQRIFADFEQVRSKLQRKVRGTGLGLSLSQRLARLLGGWLELDSEPGRGSTFRLVLPALPPSPSLPAADDVVTATDAPNPTEPAPDFSSARILVIDDDPAARYLVRAWLQPLGAAVEEADSGPAGIDAAIRETPTAIVLDLRMPVMDGEQTLRVLRADERTRAIPVVFHTSKRLEEDEEQRLRQHADDLVLKAPTDGTAGVPSLARALGRVLGRAR